MAMNARINADVCVIGAGPAGTTIAHRLASLGHDVCLIDRDRFPRPHIGASLPPSILPLLDVIGVRDRVERAGFLRPERTMVWWSQAAPTMRSHSGPPGFHVDRGAFDRLLLLNAQSNGVRVLEGTHAMQPERSSGGGWRIPVRRDGEPQEIAARLIVDASGGRGLLSGRRHRVSAPLLALYAHWRGADAGAIEGRVEAGENEWFWYAPLGGGKSVAAVLIDPKHLSDPADDGIDRVYHGLLRRFRLFRDAGLGRIEGAVKACDASSRYAEQAAGPDFIRVGDANLSLDPLSSQGVQSAIASSLQAAIVINTLARHRANTDAAIAFYRDRQQEKVRQHAAKTAAFYGERAAVCDRPFWRRRAAFAGERTTPAWQDEPLDGADRIRLSHRTTIEQTPVVQGDVIVAAAALRHESLERPVAFVGEVEIVPLLRRIEPGQSARAAVQTWSDRMPADLGWKIMHWLWQRRIVVPA
jgi:flavin-dependent dehydrogenase